MRRYTISGEYAACGRAVGQLLRRATQRRLVAMGITPSFVKKKKPLLEKLYQATRRRYPQYIEELVGMATGSQVDFWLLFALNAPETFQRERCSGIAVVERGRVLLGHNEDGSPTGDRQSWTALIRYRLPHMTFTSFCYAGELPGSAYGWNDAGLYATVNDIYVKKSDPTLPSKMVVARALLETQTIPAALRELRRGAAGGYHYYLGRGNRLLSVEQYHDRVLTTPVRGWHWHTNHYRQSPLIGTDVASRNSRTRYRRLGELVAGRVDPEVIFIDTANRPYAICARGRDKSRTLSTVFFEPRRRQARILVAGQTGSYRLG